MFIRPVENDETFMASSTEKERWPHMQIEKVTSNKRKYTKIHRFSFPHFGLGISSVFIL